MKTIRNGFFLVVMLTTNLAYSYTKVITATTAPSSFSNEQKPMEAKPLSFSDVLNKNNQHTQQISTILPYFSVGALQPAGYIPTQVNHQVFMLFSPSCPHCLDFINTQLPLIQKQIATNNIQVNIGFNPLNPLDVAAIKIIVGTLYKNKKIYNQKGRVMQPLDMLKILMEKRSEWLDPTIEALKNGKKNVVQKSIDTYIETVDHPEEKNNWLAILDPADELTYLKIFFGKVLGLDPNYIQDCVEDTHLSNIVTLFPTVVAKGECNYAPFFCVNGNPIPSDVPFTNELMKKYINDPSKKKEIYTIQELKKQIEEKIMNQKKSSSQTTMQGSNAKKM
jgi:hypothetical protein